jgi:hypothetical protein
MKLADAWIHGLRRFGGDSPHRLRLDTKLISLIGANEVGKSTLLKAFEIVESGQPVAAQDRSRRENVPGDRDIVRLRYRLDSTDHEAVAHINTEIDVRRIRWFDVLYRADGSRRFEIDSNLRRVRAPRQAALKRLQSEAKRWWPEDPEEQDEVPQTHDRERVAALIEALASDAGTLPGHISEWLRELAGELDPENDEFATELRSLADHEEASHPTAQATEILWARSPDFVRFDDDARLLQSEYDLNQSANDPGAALQNLASLANLDLVALRDAIARGETGTVRDIREGANTVLAERFAAWHQKPPVTVTLETDGPLLRIHVQSGTGPTMPFHERSDGLRQFVALVALTAQHARAVPPILLIDEIETHLHYDAQADLLAVLAEQTAVAQVVYTTHSAGCLPEDLGLGVRVIEPIEERTASTIRQNFWRDENPGMGALLMAMGAASLAFVPLRPAVIAEGGSDLVLLPSLLREAIERDHLGFAVVPGSSSAPPDRIAGLSLQGVRTAWILDADDSGRHRRDDLVSAHIPADHIFLLADNGNLEIEDLIDPETYCNAVNAYVADVGGDGKLVTADLPKEPCRRHESLITWCESRDIRSPGKIAVANKVIEQHGNQVLLDPSHAARLRSLHESVAAILTSAAD